VNLLFVKCRYLKSRARKRLVIEQESRPPTGEKARLEDEVLRLSNCLVCAQQMASESLARYNEVLARKNSLQVEAEQLAANLANAEERCTSYSYQISGLQETLREFEEDLTQAKEDLVRRSLTKDLELREQQIEAYLTLGLKTLPLQQQPGSQGRQAVCLYIFHKHRRYNIQLSDAESVQYCYTVNFLE
jgi:hypothetical protein